MGIFYATREQVMRALTVMDSARAGTLIDAKIDAASRSLEGFLHRRFYPERRTILRDWPNKSYMPTWELDLGDQEMISVEAVTAGGTPITSGVYLSRADDLAEPPYGTLNVDLSSGYAFSSGTTFQRALSIVGLFGYRDTATVTPSAVLADALDDSSTTVNLLPASGIYDVGIGALLRIGSERLIVIRRNMVSTTRTTTSALLASQGSQTFTCANASEFAEEEVILIDGERMRVDEISGTTIRVTRAWDGTTLQAHSSGSTIYALRQAVVQRGALGSTAAAHDDATNVYTHQYPGLVNELCIAETVVMLEQNAAGYARTIGTGGREKESADAGLADIRDRAWRALGRKNRSGAI